MNMKCTIYFLLMMLVYASSFAQTFQPVNKNASPEAKKLLNYLYSINGKYILSGEHGDERQLDTVKNITGKYPAVWGNDFIWHGTEDPGQEVVNEAIEKYKEGLMDAYTFFVVRNNWLQANYNLISSKNDVNQQVELLKILQSEF